MPSIGVLTQTTTAADPNVWDLYITDFTQALCTNGITWLTPQTGTDYDSYYAGAETFVGQGANVIVTAGNVAANACYDATQDSDTNVVVASAGDLTNLTNGNLTGCTNGQTNQDILNERITMMLQKLSRKKVVAVVGNGSVDPVNTAMTNAITILKGQNVPVYPASFTTAADFQDEKAIQGKLNPPAGTSIADVILVCSDPLLRTYGTPFVKAAHDIGMKTMHEFAEWHDHHGGDLCYGPNFQQLFQRAAGYVDQILNGADPADLPIFQPQLVDCVPTPKPEGWGR
jgi:ABC-type uncharacterized transport system substrate-binding protein